jgi:hypothetical protein
MGIRANVKSLRHRLPLALVVIGFALSGCQMFERSAPTVQQIEIPPPAEEMAARAAAPPPLIPTGTVVDSRVQQLAAELGALKASVDGTAQDSRAARAAIADLAARYQTLVAGITARLQVGTTPGNPELISAWNEAQGQLGLLEQNVGRLSALSTRAAANALTAGFLQSAIRSAYRLSGGIDQDHRNLDLLEDDTNRTIVAIERALNEIADDVSRQSATVASERRTMGSLALAINSGRMYGAPLATRIAAAPAAAPARPVPAAAQRRPLVTIRFDRPDVAYRQPLYDAVSAALERNPAVTFEVRGVAPARGEPADQARAANDAHRQAEGVVRSLVAMGLPSDRVSLSAATAREASVTEVRVFVR